MVLIYNLLVISVLDFFDCKEELVSKVFSDVTLRLGFSGAFLCP